MLGVPNTRTTRAKPPAVAVAAAVRVACGPRRAPRVANPQAGHYAKAGVEAGSILKEFGMLPASPPVFA